MRPIALPPAPVLQAAALTGVVAYWGWHWRPVYAEAPFIAGQIVFACALNWLLCWWRRRDSALSIAPVSTVLAINLFLWFTPEWSALQFVLVAVAVAASELVVRHRDGHTRPVFNAPLLALALASAALLATGATSMTTAVDAARHQFAPPYVHAAIFLITLPAVTAAGGAAVSLAAVLTLCGLGFLYFRATGSYFFVDTFVPVGFFLAALVASMDRDTVPRTARGRLLFGVIFAVATMGAHEWLRRRGLPVFYAWLLPIPVLNLLSAIGLVASRVVPGERTATEAAPQVVAWRPRLAGAAVWAATFATLHAAGVVGDQHPGQAVPFWQNACVTKVPGACDRLAEILDGYCAEGSGWACNEAGVLRFHGRAAGTERIVDNFSRACAAGFRRGCENIELAKLPLVPPRQAVPGRGDYPVLLRAGKAPLPAEPRIALLTRACDQGWNHACGEAGGAYLFGTGVTQDAPVAAEFLKRGCDLHFAAACSDLGLMQYQGDGIPQDRQKGLANLKLACDLGLKSACEALPKYQ